MFKSSTVKFGIFVVVAIGLLALAQAAAGPFVASAAITRPQTQDPPPTAEPKTDVSPEVSYADLFVQKFAERLGIDQAKLNDAYQGALSDTLSQAVQDGKLTRADADAIAHKIGSVGLKTLAAIPDKIDAEKSGADMKLFLIQAFAQALGLSDQEFQDQSANGKSIADLAQARGLNLDQVKQSILSSLKTKLDQAVQSGKLPQADADKFYQQLEPQMDSILAAVPNKLDAKSSKADQEKFYVDVKLYVTKAFAQALGLSEQELRDQWESGKSVADLAQAHGLSLDQVKQSALRNLKTQLDEAVQSGKVPQADADKIYQEMEP